jgi:starch synthase
MKAPLNVWFLTAEADPFAKVGGLGDVAGSLPPALRALESETDRRPLLDVRVVLPLHSSVDRARFNLRQVAELEVDRSGTPIAARAYRTEVAGVPFYLIEGEPIPRQGPVYDGSPEVDGPKFVFFSLAALALARSLNWAPQVVHANDWHTAPAVYWLALHGAQDPFYGNAATLLEVHNLPYLGVGTEAALSAYGLPPATYSALPYWAQHMALPLGLLAADHIVTVSPGYAAEILTPEFGSGLEGFLRGRQDTVSGIINGIDEDAWDPGTDASIRANYSPASLPFRAKNKTALQEEVGLPVRSDTLLLSMVTRMVHQKGVDLALEALGWLESDKWQAVILGTGDPELEEGARQLQARFPDQVRAEIRFDPAFSRRVYAGSDAMLIPSRYEPSGLTQMIAMRYGCVPIARATGGLRDTISDYHAGKDGTGFLFEEADPSRMYDTVLRALEVFQDKRRWQGLQRRGMRQDFSWARSAWKYYDLYQRILQPGPADSGS